LKKQYCFRKDNNKMKKLTYLVSAVVAGLFTSAHADVSVSGSASVVYQSAGSDTNLHNGGAVSFGLSTTTASGMTVSTSAGITNSTTSGSAGAVTGWDNLTFATGGVTLNVGNDIGLPDGVGEVGGLVGDTAAVGSAGITSTTGLTDDEGTGISLSTSLGSAGLSVYYVADSAPGATGDIDGATGTGSGVKITTAVGDVGLTVAYAAHSDTGVDDTETGASASYATGMGTISVGYTTSTGANDGNSVGVAYSMDLDADTSLGIGYQTHDVNSNSGRATDVTISRSLGGGMSVFGELRSTSGDTGTGENSTMAIGTSVSF
jgi:collagen type VII alpha